MGNGKMPDYKHKQFYKEDYKTRDYGTMMHEYEKKLERKHKLQEKKMESKQFANNRTRTWSEADQLFEDQLWAS
jgi:hypothetical protein